MSIDTAIENMIASYIDDQDFVGRTDASMEAESYTDQCIGDIQDEIGLLIVRVEELEAKPAAEPNLLQELADSVEVKEEPRAVNQIDWLMSPNDIIAGYDSKAMLESYVRSCLHLDQTNQTNQTHQAPMVIAMVLATARNLINQKLESES